MSYTYDHDLHNHSILSLCAKDTTQTPQNILRRAEELGLTTICLTDHYWDENVPGASPWYTRQGYDHISEALPLPQSENVRFLFGCETDLDRFLTLGIAKETFEKFDFVIIPTTHFHVKGFTISEEDSATPQTMADAWVKRLDAVLQMDIPFRKVGLAHLTCSLIAPKQYTEVIACVPTEEMIRLFTRAAELGVGIELNQDDMKNAKCGDSEALLRPYRIAKQCGCKFYLGSDAHDQGLFSKCKDFFEWASDTLALTEEDKFIIGA